MADVTPEQRRSAVERALADDPTASERTIAIALGCSQATVRRDMAALQRDSAVTRIDSRHPQVSRGEALVVRLRGEMSEQGLIPTSGEEELLAVARDLGDRIERLQKLVAADGERRKQRDGRIIIHPCLSEIRQCEATLARVVGGIQTMEDSPKNGAKVKAAQARWRTHNIAKAGRAEDGA
jgi:predicted ArsR family transcriptional regulator